MTDLTLTITYFAFLLGLGVLTANLLKKKHIPDTFFLLIIGLLLGPTLYANPLLMQYIHMELVKVGEMGIVPDFMRLLALIMVVFTGTFSLGFRAFKKFSSVALNIAIVGVFLNTIFFGIVGHFVFNLGWGYSFLLAAILSGTCSSVVFVFEDVLSEHKNALDILKVESILNSPLSVLLPIMLLGIMSMKDGALVEPLKYVSDFWSMIVVGVGTGIIIGLGVYKLLKSMLREYTALLLFSIALITYALAELFGGSGMLAVAVCGLIAGDLVFPEKQEVERFDDQLSDVFRISVFTLLGAQVSLAFDINEILLVLAFFAMMFLFRPLFLSPIVRRSGSQFSRKELAIMSFISPRGLSAAAMAPIIGSFLISTASPESLQSVTEITARMNNIIFLVILLSILASTITAKIVSRKREGKEKGEKEEMEKEDNKDMTDWVEENIEKTKKEVESEEELLDDAERIAS